MMGMGGAAGGAGGVYNPMMMAGMGRGVSYKPKTSHPSEMSGPLIPNSGFCVDDEPSWRRCRCFVTQRGCYSRRTFHSTQRTSRSSRDATRWRRRTSRDWWCWGCSWWIGCRRCCWWSRSTCTLHDSRSGEITTVLKFHHYSVKTSLYDEF